MNTHAIKIFRIFLILTALFLFHSSAWAQPVRDRLLGDVSITRGTDYAAIKINLTFPVRYVRHFPLTEGDEVRVQVEPIAINPQDRDALLKRESVTARPGNPALADEIVYEGDVAGGPYLTVFFNRTVTFQVKQGDDYRSILILISLPERDIVHVTETGSERTRQLQEEARQAMATGNYPRAIQIYTKLTEDLDPDVRQIAQELLGVAREGNGQLAHAKAEYQRYLELYPDSPSADRIRQRLADLLAGKPVVPKDDDTWRSDLYGGVSQFYNRAESTTDLGGTVLDQSSLDSNLDLTLRLTRKETEIKLIAIGGHEVDFLEDTDDETRVNSLYFDINAQSWHTQMRVGRQTSSSNGILGRYDGGLLRVHLTPKVAVNLYGGYPVASATKGIETDKYFYGGSFDLGRFGSYWDLNTYIINQEVNGVTDRQAVGGELRFTHPRASFFVLADYDIHYSELNALLSSASLIFPDRTTVSIAGDYRKSPFLSTSNALIGQPVDNLDELLDIYSKSDVEQFALDRTATSKTATVSITHPISEYVQIAADVSWAKFDDTEESGTVEAFEGTDDEFYYSLQLIGSSLVKDGDLATLGIRYADTTRYDIYSGSLNTRYPLGGGWIINPKMYVDYREGKEEDREQWKLRPALRLDWRIKRFLRFECEGGYEWSSERIDEYEDDTRGYFVTVGYRWDF